MYMRLMQFVVVAILAVFANPAFAQEGESQCEIEGLMDELRAEKEKGKNTKKSGNLLISYMMKASLDYRNYCVGGDMKSIDMPYYKGMNVKIENILGKYKCTWEDIPKFRKMKTVDDICREEGGLDLVPLVPHTKKKCRTEEFSKLVKAYNKAFDEDTKNCEKINLEKYRVWNAELDIVLKKANCTWKDIVGFTRIETHKDLGCKESEKKVVAVVVNPKEEDDLTLPEPVPLVDPKLKVVDLVTEKPMAVKTPPKESPVVVKPPPKKPPVVVKLPIKKPDPIVTITKTPPVPRKSHWLTYTGIGVGVAGLAVLAGGAYYGLQANEEADNAKSAITQIDIHQFNQDASTSADRANVMFGVGGAAVAAGIAMVILDLTVRGSSDTPAKKPATTSIDIGPGSAHLTVHF